MYWSMCKAFDAIIDICEKVFTVSPESWCTSVVHPCQWFSPNSDLLGLLCTNSGDCTPLDKYEIKIRVYPSKPYIILVNILVFTFFGLELWCTSFVHPGHWFSPNPDLLGCVQNMEYTSLNREDTCTCTLRV